MPNQLVRYQQTDDLHFITFSCYHRRPYLKSPATRDLFERSLESMRVRYHFNVVGYVIMPEHVHLLMSEPAAAMLAKALQAVKLSVTVQRPERPFWQVRYYDFNVFTDKKRIEKLRYIHRNPVTRGLVDRAEHWKWSSFHHWCTGQQGAVEIDSHWATEI
jgi:putative transposase